MYSVKDVLQEFLSAVLFLQSRDLQIAVCKMRRATRAIKLKIDR